MATPDTRTEAAAVKAVIDGWVAAIRRRDMAGVADRHAPDILLFDAIPPAQARGVEAYRKAWEPFFPWFGENGVFDLDELEITAGSDVAFATGPHPLPGRRPEPGPWRHAAPPDHGPAQDRGRVDHHP